MKKIKISIITIVCVLFLGACVGDLDTKPLNESDFVADRAYSTPESYLEGLAKIYGGFVLVGSEPGKADIAVADAGASELNRAFWSLQELSTDEAKCAWVNDAWVSDINTNKWTATRNDAIFAIYNRTMMLVSYVNEYLRQTTDGKLSDRKVSDELKADIHKYRAEARFLRAYAWWMALDVFGNMPFITEKDAVGAYIPPQTTSKELFDYVEAELIALTTDADLAEARKNTYPRVDKGCAWALLARLYLNAESYTGTQRWTDAREAAAKVIGLGYSLANRYDILFMGDNGVNQEVRKEMIYAVAYDKTNIQSYGGTSYIIAAAMSSSDADGQALIGSAGWGGNRTTYEYAKEYFDVSSPDYVNGTFQCNDKRAMFHIKGRKEKINDTGVFDQGWGVIKFSNLSSVDGSNMSGGAFSSTYFPMIRLAEIYLIYAEAHLRAGGAGTDATALGYLNALRQRALISVETPKGSYDLDYVFQERSRELFWESHRRTDLIRFGKYTSSDFTWPWKGGIKDGQGLKPIYKLCPLPFEDRNSNPNLTNNNGY